MLNTPQQPLAVTADKAYDSQRARQQIKDEGALPIIPSRSNASRKAYCPKRFYRQRHKIENFFCRIKDWRRIATRYDKLARNFLAATPDQPSEFRLLVEERRIIESIAGNENLEIQWRAATLKEAKAVVTQYHQYLKENSLIKSIFEPDILPIQRQRFVAAATCRARGWS